MRSAPAVRKVCVFNPFGAGGHALYTKELVGALAGAGQDRGVSVSLVTAEDLATEYGSGRYPVHKVLPRLADRGEYRGVLSWACSRATHYLRRERVFLDWLDRQGRIDVVHFQDYNAWLAPRHFRALRRRGTAVVYTVHNIHEHKDDRGFRWRVKSSAWRSAWRSCSLLLVHTEGLREALSGFLGAGHPPIRVTPHAVWGVGPGAGGGPRVRRGGAAPRLLFFGVIRKNKGLHVLLDALKLLPGVDLTIAGAPEDRGYMDRVRGAIAGLRPGRVELIDRVVTESEVGGLFRGCDLVALPYTQYTAQSGVLFLALAYGRPVVATDPGGLGESVRAWRVGEVVRPGDARSLALGIEAALAPRRYREAVEAIGRVRGGLTWEGMAHKTIDAYHEIL